MKQRTRISLLAVSLALMTSGCWDRREINDVGFALATAIDLSEDQQFEATVQVAVPTALSPVSKQGGSGNNGQSVMSIHASGGTIDQLRARIQKQLSRRLNTSHRRLIVFGEDMARHGLEDVMDELSRSPANRLRTFIVVAKGMRGAEFLDTHYPIEAYPSEAIRELEKMGFGAETTLREFFIAATLPGSEPYVSTYTLEKDHNPVFQLQGIGVFKDMKLVGTLDRQEAQGFLMLLGKLKVGEVTVRIPSSPQDDITVQVKKVKSKPNVILQNGNQPQVSYQLDVVGEVSENTTVLDLMNPKYIAELDQAVSAGIQKQAQAALKKLQSYKSDALGIGTAIYRQEPVIFDQFADQWPQLFAKQQVGIEVNVQVRQIGMLGPQLRLRDKEVKK